jgi:iron complex transport system permease protein
MQKNRKYRFWLFVLLSGILIFLFIADLLIGSVHIVIKDIISSVFSSGNSGDEIIVMQFRFPKAITAVIAGTSMAVSGLLMQTLFRNPLAGPDVLGVSSGAGLGVAVMLLTFAPFSNIASSELFSGWGLIVAACTGAGAVMVIIMLISSRLRDIMTVLIIGILIANAVSSIVSVMQYFSNATMLKTYVIWTMGNLGNLSPPQLRALTLSATFGLLLALTQVKPLNAILMGETFARTVGVNIKISRIILFASSSVLAGSITAFCGPIAFIGVAVPHITRLLFKSSDHRILLPGSIITGSIVMLFSDMVSNIPGSGTILPINTVTSLIGIPVIIWIIIGKKGIKKSM